MTWRCLIMCLFLVACGRSSPPEDFVTEGNDDPIVEHPSGEFDSAVDAIAEAFRRIRASESSGSIFLCGQGQGSREGSTQVVEVSYRAGTFHFEEAVPDALDYATAAGINPSHVDIRENGASVRVVDESPERLALFLDSAFRLHFRVRPFDGEDDYAFGAERE